MAACQAARVWRVLCSTSCRRMQQLCLADRTRSRQHALLHGRVLPWDPWRHAGADALGGKASKAPFLQSLSTHERPRGDPARLQLVGRPGELHALAAAAEHGLDQQR